ncbi:peptidase S24/S26A/S26B/S26C, partial [Pisolithus orientalis]|uniref:peptidase S24/S26A/S26B/S26C n=1 Tax=Pisolithus orientalis TaxID=936130 RepID=UPI002224BB87
RFLQAVNFVCAFHLFKENVGSPCLMDGPSMFPTFDVNGEIAVECVLAYRLFPDLVRGELVSLKSPFNPNRIVCKRVIGLAGDTICVDPTGSKAPSTEHVVVPEGHVWVAGDNTSCSIDSRDYGPVSMALIRGKIVARVCVWLIFLDDITHSDYNRFILSIDSKYSFQGSRMLTKLIVATSATVMVREIMQGHDKVSGRSSSNNLLARLVQT